MGKQPRPKKLVTACEHTNRAHKAKGMCAKCYFASLDARPDRPVRTFASVCEHTQRRHYAKGLCKPCCLAVYRRSEKRLAYNEANREKRAKQRAEYEINNREKIATRRALRREETIKKQAARYRSNREQIILKNATERYGITFTQLDAMFAVQENRCICGLDFGERFPAGKRRIWNIDHDHECCPGQGSCGKCVRGLLCSPCNTAIGLLREDPLRLEALMKYLKSIPKEQMLDVAA